MTVERVSAEVYARDKALSEYRRKLIEHRDIDASLKHGKLLFSNIRTSSLVLRFSLIMCILTI